jgi:hypothetical protein
MSVSYGGDSITFADGSIVASGSQGFKNKIINGAFMIDQRNAGAYIGGSNAVYSADRWGVNSYNGSNQTGIFLIQRMDSSNASAVGYESGSAPVGHTYSLKVTSSAATSVGSGGIYGIYQYIEGFNTADLNWGTANAVPVTLSFWTKSSLTGTFGGSLRNSAVNRSYPFSYTISTANTWEYKTVTITGDTSGTWLKDNGVGIQLTISLGQGTSYSSTAGTWQAAGYNSVTGAVSVVGTSGATFYIAGVQFEKGSTASSFEFRSYGKELMLCQRYFGSYPQTNGTYWYNISTGGYRRMHYNFPVIMRATPSCTVAGATNGNPSGSLGIDAASVTTCVVTWNQNDTAGLVSWNSSALITASAEL